MRRVLHVPAEDLRSGDLISFHDVIKNFPGSQVAESRIVQKERDPQDGTIYLKFEEEQYTEYCNASKQFALLLDL